jgi:hypothetical protein
MIRDIPYIATYGSDPEMFLTRNGQVIGSERVIPEVGIGLGGGKIIRDGIQIELNPYGGDSLRHRGYLRNLLVSVKQHVPADVSVSFEQVVDVPQEEFAALSPQSGVLGCMPSLNAYGIPPLRVDENGPQPPRSAGGHIHVGFTGAPTIMDYRRDLIPLMDIIVGNQAVLLDREPRAAERRKLYGRAGEYRIPRYGIEYRTQSNWWLHSPGTCELVFGLTKTAVDILFVSVNKAYEGVAPDDMLANMIDINLVIKAIMNNDKDLAWSNWQTIKEFLSKWVPNQTCYPLRSGTFDLFEKLVASGLPKVDSLALWSHPDWNTKYGYLSLLAGKLG